MKFFTTISIAMTLMGANAAPDASDSAIVSLQDSEGKAWVGDGASLLKTRDIEARCSCFPSCFGDGHSCEPGKCQCSGHNGCWSYNGGPFICQIGPDGPA